MYMDSRPLAPADSNQDAGGFRLHQKMSFQLRTCRALAHLESVGAALDVAAHISRRKLSVLPVVARGYSL